MMVSTIHCKIAFFLASFSSLIIFILVFPLKMKYFEAQCSNETSIECPRGQFACPKCPNICIPQIGRCNRIADCPEKEDEEDCQNEKLDTSGLARKYWAKSERDEEEGKRKWKDMKPANCTEAEREDYSKGCPCRPTDTDVVTCRKQNLTSIPTNMAPSVWRVVFMENNIKSIDNITWPESMNILSLAQNQIESVDFSKLSRAKKLAHLYLSNNPIKHLYYSLEYKLESLTNLDINLGNLATFDTQLLTTMPQLRTLFLKNNSIDLPDDSSFKLGVKLEEIHLSFNCIRKVRSSWFSNMTQLQLIDLYGNYIEYIEEGSFDNNHALFELDLSRNQITQISRYTFVSFNYEPLKAPYNLDKLILAENPIISWNPNALVDLENLTSLNLEGIEFDANDITSILILPKSIQFIYFKRYIYCQEMSTVLDESVLCKPLTDGISTRRQLLRDTSLENILSFMAIICTVGNVFVFAWRTISRERDDVLDACIKNLSVADLMMGFYLCAIYWKGSLVKSQGLDTFEWKKEYMCTFMGVLAILSSELSLFILLIITIERYRASISTKVSDTYEKKRRAKYYVCLAWLFSLLIALFPLISKLINTNRGNIYSSSNLCIPLHIEDPFSHGWMYSAFIYLGVNGLALLVMVILYIRIYQSTMNLHQNVNRFTAHKHEDAILALRLILIVITGCLCWLPIAVVKVRAIMKKDVDPWTTGWLVVFIIPINSALNPIIYTLAAPSSLRTALYRKFRPLRRYIGASLIRYFDNLIMTATCCRDTDDIKNISKRNSDEFSSLSFGKRRRKNGSSSTTCDTLDTSVTSTSQRRSTEVSKTDSTLLGVDNQACFLYKQKSSYQANEGEPYNARNYNFNQRSSQNTTLNNTMTTITAADTLEDLESQSRQPYECLVIYQDEKYENLIRSDNQSSTQGTPRNEDIYHLTINQSGSTSQSSARKLHLENNQCDSLNSFSSYSGLNESEVSRGSVRNHDCSLDYHRDNSISSLNDQNNNGDSTRIHGNNSSCEVRMNDRDGDTQIEEAIDYYGTNHLQRTLDDLLVASSGQTNPNNQTMFNNRVSESNNSGASVLNSGDLNDACRASFDSQSSQTNLI